MHNPPAEAIIKLAILAVGGQGGGVLGDWIVAVAERNGWYAQSTSVPGVAQRTGATIYYVEMVPASARLPILALMPAPGDVDIVIAAELMEAGRAVLRGLVTPDRTTLIYSLHRAYAVSEKMVPGDGVSDPAVVVGAAATSARAVLSGDFEAIAREAGSVISASLFGALAASGTLPFGRESFEAAIRAGGRGIDESLAAFALGHAAAIAPSTAVAANSSSTRYPHVQLVPELGGRIETDFPAAVHDMTARGAAKVLDFQDLAYAREYLAEVATFLPCDSAARAHALTREAAKYLANAMCYDDIIRVADLKTRGERWGRIGAQMGLADDAQILALTEYFHPTMREVCGILPARLGRNIEDSPRLFNTLDRMINRGRQIRSDTLRGFLQLYLVAGFRRLRRGSLRYRIERAHRERWLAEAKRVAPGNYELAVEIVRLQRLVKGYSDTHARGLSKFDLVMGAVPLLEGRSDAADWLRRLREAALKDEDGTLLKGALRTVASL